MAKFIYLAAEELYLNPDHIVSAKIDDNGDGTRAIDLVLSDGKLEGFAGEAAEQLIRALTGLAI